MKNKIKYRFSILLYALCLFVCPTVLLAQDVVTYEGTVFDVFGNPIENVRILAEDGTELAKTDISGIFKIENKIILNGRLEKEGYASQIVAFRKGENNNYKLNTYLLNEQISVGYGLIKRSDLVSSVSSVSEDVLSKFSVSKPSYALYGLLPGLIVEEKAEVIDGTSPNMFIRGKSTFGNASNTPIVIIDGFERDLDDISYDDIASVNVLKDAAATAIYGMKGANGVIIVETKRGAVGKPRYKVNMEQGIQSPTRIAGFTNSADYARYYNQALVNDGLSARYTDSQIAGFENGNSLYYPDNQWQNELVEKYVPVTKVNLSATGGTKIAKYYVSLGYRKDIGNFKNTEYMDYNSNPVNNRYNFRTNLDVVAINNLDLKLDVAGQVNNRVLGNSSQSSIWDMIYTYPQNEFPVYQPDGSLGGTAAFPLNPVGVLQRTGYRKVLDRYIQSSLSGEYHLKGIFQGLSFGGRYAYDNTWTANEYWTKSFSVKEINGQDSVNNPILLQVGTDGKLSYRHYSGDDAQSRRENIEGFIKYGKTFNTVHALNGMFVYHQDRLTIDQNNPYSTQFWSGRIDYNYDSKYLVELDCSYSGSEAFAKKNRYEFYPAAALGWVISKENFLKGNKVIDFLKIKSSAGLSGNSDLGSERFTYRQMTTWISGNYYFGESPDAYNGRQLGTLSNPDLKAEKSFKFDIGFEAQLFKSLYVSAGYFFENRFDILTSQSGTLPSLSGITYPNINAGSTNKQGIELQLSYNKQINRDWNIFGNFNFLTYSNTITSILQTPLPENSQYQSQIGKGIGTQLELVAEGIFQSQKEIDNSPLQMYGPVSPGDIKYKDVNGDGVIDDYDRVYSTKRDIPNTDMSLNCGFKFKNFDFSVLLHSQLGSEIYLGDAKNVVWPFNGSSYRVSNWVANRIPWTTENASIANFPRLSTIENANNYRRSTYWTVNGDRLRLRNLEIGYTLPATLAGKLYMSDCRFYIRGVNLLVLDHIKFLDPAALAGSPMLSSIYIGCNINL